MGFYTEKDGPSPLAIPQGTIVSPRKNPADWSTSEVFGAAWRTESAIGSWLNGYSPDTGDSIEEGFRPYEQIQGTPYEDHAERFVGVRNSGQLRQMQAQIDREIEDRKMLADSGGLGFVSSMAAAMISPSSLLPGGALVRGAKGGISIGRTAANTSIAGGQAALFDEAMLHATQQTRTAEDSAWAVGGSVVLSGLLGAGAGTVGKWRARDKGLGRAFEAAEQQAAALELEDGIVAVGEWNEGRRSVGAMDVTDRDVELVNEKLFQAIRATPVVRRIVTANPMGRLETASEPSARLGALNLAETAFTYRVNLDGQSPTGGVQPVEAMIKAKRQGAQTQAQMALNKAYSTYWNDGEVGTVGTLTAPAGGYFSNLAGMTEKMTSRQFMDEVGKAMVLGDHPIPQVNEAASKLRELIFAPAEADLKALGVMPDGLQLKHEEGYLSRIYNTKLINAHWNSGDEFDLRPVLIDEFKKSRAEARILAQEERAAQAAEGSKVQSEHDVRAEMDDLEIERAVDDVKDALNGLKANEPHFRASLSNPMRARTLDVPTEVLFPWLDTDASFVLNQYMRNTMPEIEMMKRFDGDVEMTAVLQKITDDYNARIHKLKANSRARRKLEKELDRVKEDLQGIRDRLLGRYGMPKNPEDMWVAGMRLARGLSYPAYLSNMTVSAMPDVALTVARNGFENFGEIPDAMSNPKRYLGGLKEAAEEYAVHEYVLNGRFMSMADMFDPMGRGSIPQRGLAQLGQATSMMSGMVPWNIYWKARSGLIGGSRLAKAATAMAGGKATKRQMRLLGEANIEPWMADRIAKQIEKYGDKDGALWFPHGRDWTDGQAYEAFRMAMNREIDLQIITPGQELPLTFSQEGVKFILQFKSFLFSMHHRFLVAGLSHPDAEFAAAFLGMVYLGGQAGSLSASLFGYEQKQGKEWWLDALDRSGTMGWLMEIYNIQSNTNFVSIATGGYFDGRIGDEQVSRYQTRSMAGSLAGPSIGMGYEFFEGLSALGSTRADGSPGGSWRDVRKVMRPLPWSNAHHLQWIYGQVEDAMVSSFGARPREE